MAPAGPDVRQFHGYHTAAAIVPMILDGGDAARVASINLQYAPYVGIRFEYGGTLWEVTRAQDHVRGWVAEPLSRLGATLFSKGRVASSRRGGGPAPGVCSRA
jgi:hypothetical protein